MKKYLLFLSVFALGACDDRPSICSRSIYPIDCQRPNPERIRIFEVCLNSLGDMRNSGGGDYTTHDDEDIDQAVKACQSSSGYVANSVPGKKVCVINEEYKKQQELCAEKGS